MDNINNPLNENELLYDPMFAKNPNDILKDDTSKGIFGKVALKKAVFIIVLLLFISFSMYFSFRTVSKNMYTYKENGTFENGNAAYILEEYHGDSSKVLIIDFVRDENNKPDTSKPVNEVGKYAVNCNESLVFVYIADTVEKIDPKAFYTCKNLMAFFVDENNPNYISADGVLYRCENGVPAEIMMYPQKNAEYRASLSLGLVSPVDSTASESFLMHYDILESSSPADGKEKNSLALAVEENFSEFEIPETVTVINELCFTECQSLKNIKLGNIKEIETLAFFKCYNLQSINIPDSVLSIGSDAFSSCTSLTDIFIPSSVKTIGHHAFYNCSGADAVRMECSEEEAKEMELGQKWVPQKRNVIMRDIEIKYNEEREVN